MKRILDSLNTDKTKDFIIFWVLYFMFYGAVSSIVDLFMR